MSKPLQDLSVGVTALLELTIAAGKISQLISTARAEGRGFTLEEMTVLQAADDAARVMLVASIAKQQNSGE